MNLVDLYDESPKRKRKAAKSRAALKPLSKMTKAEINALPEREFIRLLKPDVRCAYLAAKKLKGAL